jgi:hypothetical protein
LRDPRLDHNVGFTAEVDEESARAYAASFLAPDSTLPLTEFVADILATDGAARAGLMASLKEGRPAGAGKCGSSPGPAMPHRKKRRWSSPAS